MKTYPWRGQLREDEPMADHATWRAGGHAKCAYLPTDLDDLATFLASIRQDETVMPVGLGSNLLVRNGGFNGTVILTHGALNVLRLESDGVIYAEAGVPCAKVARFAAQYDLGGVEFLAGIPGTLGGALAMNAGCHGHETWDHVSQVMMLTRRGEQVLRCPDDFAIAYRRATLKKASDELFAAAWLRLTPRAGDAIRSAMREFLDKRNRTQPLSLPNAGSVFRNPPGDFAARLIEAAGGKGLTHEGAAVSEIHANFIVNPGGKASADAIEILLRRVQALVQEKFGVLLHPEVRIVGTTHE